MDKLLVKTDLIEIKITDGYQLYMEPLTPFRYSYSTSDTNASHSLYDITQSRYIKNRLGECFIEVIDFNDNVLFEIDLSFDYLRAEAEKLQAEELARPLIDLANSYALPKQVAITRDGYVTIAPPVLSDLKDYQTEINRLYAEIIKGQEAMSKPNIWPIELKGGWQGRDLSKPVLYKCECGAEHTGSPRHSDWCPKYTKDT